MDARARGVPPAESPPADGIGRSRPFPANIGQLRTVPVPVPGWRPVDVLYISGVPRTGEELMDAVPLHPDIDPATAVTVEDFAELLRRLRTRADQPSLRTMERWAIRHGKSLSRSAVADMLAGRTFPTKARLFAFLQVCGVEPADDPRWETAWNRLAEERRRQQPGISRLGSAGEQAAVELGLGMHDDEAEDLLEPTWSDAEERLAAITNEATATAETLREQLAQLRLAGAEVSATLDNARLSRLESVTAVNLQRSLLPIRPPRIPGVRIAYDYHPGHGNAAGGDWFDAIRLPSGRVALVVGDVMGHGLMSAAVMGQFRTSIITMASMDLPPAQLLRQLDNLTHHLSTEHLATCIYSVYDPVRRTLTLANAGHVPPVLVDADGKPRLLEIPTGAPIGVGGVAFEEMRVPIDDGSWLVMCTDGLVESRSRPIDEGLEALCAGITDGPADSPQEVCEQIMTRLQPDYCDDDVALLVARLDGIAPDDVAEWQLPRHPSQARVARAATVERLAAWGLHNLVELAELLVSELVTNALRVARHDVQLRLMRTDNKLLVEVSDDDHNMPTLRPASATDEDGRGLGLVSRLSDEWGASRTAGGKVVWFEVRL
ncbi:SpoIIE family protein phosphatase [Streptomyces sp. SID5468]|nr:SpoIIE family protein phosphatase [Streptomyces sp. SID5468]